MSSLIVVPARYGSSRFPGKPLHVIAGRTLLERVARIATLAVNATSAQYVVATDAQAIVDHCRSIGAPVVMTDPELRTGSDRVLAAAAELEVRPEFVVNLQGDAPFTEVDHVVAVLTTGRKGLSDVVTPVVRLSWEELDDLRERKKNTPFSGTTCVRDAGGRAYWFSKQILPALRDEQKLRAAEPAYSPVFRHIGLYGYRLEALERFTLLSGGYYEKMEGLEQLRFIENGMSVQALEVKRPHISMSGIDTLEDAVLAESLIKRYGDPYEKA